jgi:tetratricopeptide (TPR) repeat protein
LILYITPVVLVIAAALAIYLLHPFRPPTSVAKRVAIVPFENQTEDPTLDPLGRMVADWTTQSLLQSGLAEVVSPERLSQTKGSQSAFSIAKNMGASTIVTGTYYKAGATIQFQAKVLGSDERVLQAIGPVSSSAANILDGVEAVRQAVLGALAPLLEESLREFWYQGAKPPSFEAYQQYNRGAELFKTRRDWRGALEYFKRAYAADTSFVMALIYQSLAYQNLAEYAQSDSVVRILDERRTRLAPLEQLALDEARSELSGDLPRALDAARRLAKMAPGSMWVYQWGYLALRANRPQECLEALRTLDPERMWLPYWYELTGAYHLLGEHQKELAAAKRARELLPTELGGLSMEIWALVGLGRIEDARKLVEDGMTFPKQTQVYSTGAFLRQAAQEFRAHGREEDAVAILDRAIQWYRSRPAEEMTFSRLTGYANTLYHARRWDEAKSVMEELLREAPRESREEIGCRSYLGLIAARQGDREKALQVSDWLRELKRPYMFGVNTYGCACIAAVLGDKDQAITLLKQSFLEGTDYTSLHTDVDFEPLWDYPPFKEITRPKG